VQRRGTLAVAYPRIAELVPRIRLEGERSFDRKCMVGGRGETRSAEIRAGGERQRRGRHTARYCLALLFAIDRRDQQ